MMAGRRSERRTLKRRTFSAGLVAVLLLGISTPVLAQQERGDQAGGVAPTAIRAGNLDVAAASDSAAPQKSAAEILRPRWSVFDAESPAALAAPLQTYDSWGVQKNFGLAAGEVLLINGIVWAFNEYIRGANFTQVSPRSWYENIKKGFTWDDNHFNTNQFAHPYHGNLYFNSARTNGFNYWESLPFAIAGSFLWECCGETHRMSINDWVATSIGGAALGEMTYRVSSTVLDNTATGSKRMWREIGATLINPVRGFNRLTSGRWSDIGENPSDRMPDALSNRMAVGVRVIGEGESISENTRTNAFVEFDFRYGDPFEGEHKAPFDYFLMGLQLNFSEKQLIGRLQVRGDLYTKDLKEKEKVKHVFTVAQNYDYFNNHAYEFGGQSVSASVLSRFDLSRTWQLATALDGYGILMGAINSDFAFLAEFPPDFDQENLRTYDFGPGVAGALGAFFFHSGREVLMLRYRYNFIYTLNGSVEEGDEAWHTFQWLMARGLIPIRGNFGIGVDAAVYLRNSEYTCNICEDTEQRNPEVRLYGSWKVGG
jgi:hypothetical protein